MWGAKRGGPRQALGLSPLPRWSCRVTRSGPTQGTWTGKELIQGERVLSLSAGRRETWTTCEGKRLGLQAQTFVSTKIRNDISWQLWALFYHCFKGAGSPCPRNILVPSSMETGPSPFSMSDVCAASCPILHGARKGDSICLSWLIERNSRG